MMRRRVTIVCLAALLAGCAVLSPKPDRSRFFMLTPIAETPGAGGDASRTVGVGPLSFPRYLDRPEMVTRIDTNEIRPAPFDYWAGSLPRQFESVLAKDLQILLGGGPVQTYPWYVDRAPELVLEAEIHRFERAAGGQVHLAADWRLRKGASQEILYRASSVLSGPAPDADPQATAAALSALVGDLSRAVATAVRSLGPLGNQSEGRR